MTVFEGWDYDVSVYYSFVSLTTIGFGDYVAGRFAILLQLLLLLTLYYRYNRHFRFWSLIRNLPRVFASLDYWWYGLRADDYQLYHNRDEKQENQAD